MKKSLLKYFLVSIAGLIILLLTPAIVSELRNTEIVADIHKIEKAHSPYLYQYNTPTFDLYAGEENDLPNFKITQAKRSLDFNVIVDPNPSPLPPEQVEESGLGSLKGLTTVFALEDIKVVDENTDPAIEYVKVNESSDFTLKPDQEKIEIYWELLSEQDFPSLEFKTEKMVPRQEGNSIVFYTRTQRKAFELKNASLTDRSDVTTPVELTLTESEDYFSITLNINYSTQFPTTLKLNIVSLFHERLIDASPLESDFSALEKPQFLINISKVNEPLKSALMDKDYTNVKFGVIDSNGIGHTMSAELIDSGGSLILRFTSGGSFTPGLYDLLIKYKDEPSYIGVEEFSWGVLVLNPDQSIYKPGQKAKIDMAVLDEMGRMVCDANVRLEITNPNGNKTTLSTADGQIKISPECKEKDTQIPDYTTTYSTTIAGDYTMKLTAITSNGSYTINDKFTANPNSLFYVKRVGPTRIFPPKTYTMTLYIEAHRDVSQIIETVPSNFSIEDSSEFTLNQDGNQTLTWNKQLKKGSQIKISYRFKGPNISPALFFIGPLKLGSWQETRVWQIASDLIGVQNDATANNCTNASTCAVTLDVPATATMVVVAVFVRDTETISSVSDGDGDTYNVAYSQGTGPTVALYYATTITANASKSITANLSGSTADTIIDAYTLTGTEISSPIDATATNTASSSSLNANITTNSNNSLIAYVAGQVTNGTQSLTGTGQALRGTITQGGGTKYAAIFSTEITTSSGNNDQTSSSTKSGTWRAIAVEIKIALAPPGPTNNQLLRHGTWFDSGVEQPMTF